MTLAQPHVDDRTYHEQGQAQLCQPPAVFSGWTMTRSILWISSSAPFSNACGGLPQPRSRMALAAETRAACVASFDRMTPTSALIALLVWLRASERISVIVFLGMALRILQKFGARDAATAHRGADDIRIHANPSHTAIATRPSSASEIRQTVMHCFLTNLNARHDR